METALDRVNNALLQYRVKNNIGRSYFSDADAIPTILNKQVVQDIVHGTELQLFQIPDIVQDICNSMRIIFAVLIQLRIPQAVQKFIDKSLVDKRLPLECDAVPLPPGEQRAFFDAQWEFIPFSIEPCLYREIRNEYVLPIIEHDRMGSLDGSFGRIAKIKLDSGLHKLSSPNERSSTFILKTLKAYIEPDSKLKFEDELNCLGTFRRLKHPNIVELLFSFTYLGEYHMIFPQYPLDLAQFLKLEEPPGDFRRPQAFCEALSGLASAISSVHNVKLTPQDHEIDLQRIGYHHDLRPANVLVSHNSFLLADFGLARIKEIDKGSKTNFKETKGDYFAPECQDQNFANQIVGRPVDIWAFGCMVVEMVTYLQRGATGVQEARVQRSAEVAPGWTDCRFYHGNCLRPAVEGHIHDLESENDVSREVVCLLQIAKLMLSIDVDQRPKADKVSQYMAHVAIKSQFHATQASVAQYLEIIDNDQSFEVPSLELWFISNKLGAWGQVLGLSDSQIDTNRVCYPVGVTEAMNIDLRKLESIFQVALHDQIWTRTGMDGTSAQYDLQEESRTTMEGLIQRLEPKDKRSFESVCRSVMLSQTNLKNTSRYGEMPGQQEPDYGDLAAIAEVKQLYDVFERLTEIEPSYITLLLDERCLRGIHPVDGHEFGYFRSQLGEVSQKQEVLVERVAYSAKWKEQSYEEKVTKIASLAKLLNRDQQPIGFRFLRCLGVILSDTDQAYKFLFELPGDESQRRPKSLYSLFLKNSKSWKPDLQQRLRLAQGIVLAVEALHTIGWLHKALHPHNILFFHPSTDALETLDLAEFYITNFRMSRPDGMTWVSEGPDLNFGYRYQHPYYIPGTRFCKSFEIYTLGIMLLEIGTWWPLEQFAQRHTGESPEAFRKILLDKYVPRLNKEIGSGYRQVVECCLNGHFDTAFDNGAVPAEVSMFSTDAVEPLLALYFG